MISLFNLSCNDDESHGLDKEVEIRPTHYFYATFGTLPTLYAGLHVLSHNKPSYFAYERTSTFDPEFFPSNVTLSVTNGTAAQEVMRDYMKKKILEINERDPKAVFGFYVDDIRSRLAFDWFTAQGIDSSRVKVTLLSDGTGTYDIFYKNFGDVNSAENNWESVKREVNSLPWAIELPSEPTKRNLKALGEFNSFTWPFYMSTFSNYSYLLQDASLFETNSPFIREEMKKMNLISQSPQKMLNELNPIQQLTFYKMANFDRNKFVKLFNKSPKKNLIIIGTVLSNNQKHLLNRVYKEYESEYDIFYKPHPGDSDYIDYETTYPGLTLLPAQMPFEIFVWSLMDEIDVIGGNSSTVFITVPTDKVKFIFAKNSEVMPRPLNLLYKDITTIDWME